MTRSNLTSEVLVNANITWVSMKVGYRWKEMPENYTGRKLQLHVNLERLRKKYIELCGRLGRKKISPGRCAGNKSIFSFGLSQNVSMAEVT